LGNPTDIHLTPGQACDLDEADRLIDTIKADTLIADKGYDADERVLDRLKAASIKPAIPPKSNRKGIIPQSAIVYSVNHKIISINLNTHELPPSNTDQTGNTRII